MLFNARRDLSEKQVGTDLILYDLDNKALHVLNLTAAEVFKLCDGSHTPEDMARALVKSFDGVKHIQACKDVDRALDILEAQNLVTRKE